MSLWRTVAEWFRPAALEPAGGSALATERRLPVAFTAAVVALAAKMAKADGVVVGVEVEAFQRAFRVDPKEARNVAWLFDLAKQSTAGYESYADQIARIVNGDRAVLRDVLACLFLIATADRVLHPAEDAFLSTVATRLGLTDTEYRQERAHFMRNETGPYEVLGLTTDASDTEVKQRYKTLVREAHPDVLTGRGVPAEMIALATRRLAAVNDAYAAIRRERGL